MKTVTTGLTLGLGLLVIMVTLSAMFAAVFMVGLALLHHDLPVVPALGFWASFGVNLLLGTVAAPFRSKESR